MNRVFDYGVNDANYLLRVTEELPKVAGKRVRRIVWECPHYVKWKSMLQRCLSESFKNKCPTYWRIKREYSRYS